MTAAAPFATAVLAVVGCASFGAASRSGCTKLTGTFGYWAPEIFAVQAVRRESYGYRVDCWAFGISIYPACCGMAPFAGAASQHEEPRYILDTADFNWLVLSVPVQNTISALLVVDDSTRCSCDDIAESLRDVA